MKIRFACVLAIAIALGLAGCSKDDGATIDGATTSTSEVKSKDNKGEKTSLEALLKKNKNIKCVYTYTDITTSSASSGTLYIAGDRMYGNFTTKLASGTEQKSNMLRDHEWQYIWSDGSTTGFKIRISDAEKFDSTSTTAANTGKTTTTLFAKDNLEQNYDCDDWKVDESMLQVPAGINFVDYLQLTRNLNDPKQYCTYLEEAAAREACEKAAG